MILKKVISGCQNGADQAGVYIAKLHGIETGGCMPKGFKTLDGNRPEFKDMYNVTEHSSSSYPGRTYDNVKNSDATIRFAFDFSSAGELCTLKAIKYYNKPYFDVNLNSVFIYEKHDNYEIKEIAEWLVKNYIQVLNVAGNSNKTNPTTFDRTSEILDMIIKELKSYDNI